MCIWFLNPTNTIIHSPTEPCTPYNVTVYALNENGNGESTIKTNFTVQGGQFVFSIIITASIICDVHFDQ